MGAIGVGIVIIRCVHQGGEESMGGIGGKPAEVLPPVGAARLSGGAARADSERRKSAVDFSLSERVQAVVRQVAPPVIT